MSTDGHDSRDTSGLIAVLLFAMLQGAVSPFVYAQIAEEYQRRNCSTVLRQASGNAPSAINRRGAP
jgi:hypothetical protein